ncbi:MAG: hypothetical protein SGJ11_11920 [Phycisphaerae bacterium]|nr:hypothetical protein [Phycisphaerae bacterium]
MGLLDFIWNIRQDARLRDVEADRRLNPRPGVSESPHSTERMTLVMQAMWELLSERVGVTEVDLLRKLEEIDLRDGTADGRHGARTIACPACNRPNRSERTHCVYCDATLPMRSAFDKL